MAKSPWQQRIRRAELLAKQHTFAAEFLGFYIYLARFQEELYQRLQRGGALPTSAANCPDLLASFPSFLKLIEDKAPEALSQVARDFRQSDSKLWAELFAQCWANIDPPGDPAEFLLLAFLQPYAELARSRAALPIDGYNGFLCPFCNRKPAAGVLRQQGDAGRRGLICGFCLTEWEFRRLICPGCGQQDHARLPVYTAAELPYIRVECCDECKTYIKTIDFTKNGLADPLVDELASVPLNLWAQEHGYAKLQRNLLGM